MPSSGVLKLCSLTNPHHEIVTVLKLGHQRRDRMSTIQPESTLTATEIAAGTITASDVATRRPIVSAHLGCLQSFNRLLQLIPNSDLISPDTQLVKRVRDEFERYQLWAGNVGAGHSKYKLSLDYRLEDASFYSEQVCVSYICVSYKLVLTVTRILGPGTHQYS